MATASSSSSAEPRSGEGSTSIASYQIADDIKIIQKHKLLFEQILREPSLANLSQRLRDELEQANAIPNSIESKIVFMGESGSGKSTTLNALLGMQLLPAGSSGEACTAIPIEVHYAERGQFRGEIDYVNEGSWREELKRVQNILRNGCVETEIEPALQKIKMVYPHLTPENLKEMSIDTILAQNESVLKLRAGKDVLQNETWDEFTNSLTKLAVASVRRNQSQIWPLVEVVRLYVHSPVLRNGLVLVDVPGVLDSNRARADRAQAYVRQSTAICIVTNAQRCGSNTNTYDLVRDVLRQVNYACRIDRVILVNSKFDDFETDEVQKHFATPEIGNLHEQLEKAKRDTTIARKSLINAHRRLESQEAALNRSKTDIRTYKSKLTASAKNKIVYDTAAYLGTDMGRGKAKSKGLPLSASTIQDRIEEFENSKSEAENSIRDIQAQIRGLEREYKDRKTHGQVSERYYNTQLLHALEQNAIELQRNELVKIVKYCHEEVAVSAMSSDDISNSRSLAELSDESHEERTQNIPIFCVSGKAYLHLREIKICDDGLTKKMKHETDTGIPALCDHLKGLAQGMHQNVMEGVLNKLSMTLKLLCIHVSKTSTQQPVDPNTAIQAANEAKLLARGLHAVFRSAFDAICTSLQNQFHIELTEKRLAFSKTVAHRVVKDLKRYGKFPTRDTMFEATVGLYPQEYRVVVSGHGIHSGKRVQINFNTGIANLLKDALHIPLTQLYMSNTSYSIRELQRVLESCIDKFEFVHNQIRSLADASGVSTSAQHMLARQFEERKAELRQLGEDVGRQLKDVPPEAEKDTHHYVEQEMLEAYGKAQAVAQGRGMLVNMSTEITGSIGDGSIMDKCLGKVHKELESLTKRILEHLGRSFERFSRSVLQNYEDAFEYRDQFAMMSSDPVINRLRDMLFSSGLITSLHAPVNDDDIPHETNSILAPHGEALTEGNEMFFKDPAGIKTEAQDSDDEMNDGEVIVEEDTDEMREDAEIRDEADAITTLYT